MAGSWIRIEFYHWHEKCVSSITAQVPLSLKSCYCTVQSAIWLTFSEFLIFCKIWEMRKICSCYRAVTSAIWEIFSEFLIFCNLFHEPLGQWNNSKIWERVVTRQRVISTLSLNACLNKMYQELSYLLIVSGLLNII